MADIFVPGLNSRFNTDKLVEDMMRIERLPRDRTERNINSLESQKVWWDNVGRRITAMRESARDLFSFQNPFSSRTASSSDSGVISATATREAGEQEIGFTVKQMAQADRFLSTPLDERTTIDAGQYTFTIGNDEVSFNFRGGSLREFADVINQRGGDKIGANVLTVQPGTRSLLIESKATGAENSLGFADDAETLALRLGIVEQVYDTRREIPLNESTVMEGSMQGAQPVDAVSINEGTVGVPPLASARIPLDLQLQAGSAFVLRLETATMVNNGDPVEVPRPPTGPQISSSGSVSHAGITIENSPSTAPFPQWTPPPVPQRVDNMAVFSLAFSDGSTATLPPITDTGDFTEREFNLSAVAGGRTIVALNIDNSNTHREIMVRSAMVLDPNAVATGQRPVNAVSTAQDAVISMEGIEMTRPSNVISDIIPGVTLTVRGVSDRPVRLDVSTDRDLVKDSIISLIGSYNRLMAEINVLTRSDPTIIDELSYLPKDEADSMRERLGSMTGDSSLNQLRNSMMRIASSPHPTDMGRELSLLSQIGISTNARGAPGFDQARLRGYLEINEAALDSALENNMPAVRQLFGMDTTGDLVINSGVAFSLDTVARPFVELGGIIALKTGTIDSRLRQDNQRLASIDRQLAAKESDLRMQFSRMESAFSQMEQTSAKFDSFMNNNN